MRIGHREKGEALLALAFERRPSESGYYLRAAERLLGIPDR
jgi:hypothetical protein